MAAPPTPGLVQRLKMWVGAEPPQTQTRGLYLFGGVGRGKTYIVDMLFAALPENGKRRVHFHRFMDSIHTQLKAFKNRTDPLALVGRRWAREVGLLCLDEFQVTDIADAMLLGRLLEHLLAEGVVLVTTSNTPPGELYQGGLQRARFLPTIELIQSRMEVLHMGDGMDYRLRALARAEIYHWPLDRGANAALEAGFNRLASGFAVSREPLRVLGREIPTVCWVDGTVWLRFSDLCQGTRSTADYIEIGRCFHTVFLQGLLELDDSDPNATVRFINLIDEFYDRHVNLLLTAEVGLERLYSGERFAKRFERTRSRLREMQSTDYLATEHLP